MNSRFHRFVSTSSLAVPVVAGTLCLFPFSATQAFGQATVTTDPAGYTALPLLANSDTLIAIPFTRPVEFVGAIGSVSGNTITLAGSPGWVTGQYQYVAGVQPKTYYAIIGPNTAALTGTVTMTSASATVVGVGTTFTGQIAVGDELLVNGLAYDVGGIASNTSLTLARAYTGATATGLSATSDHSPKEGSCYTVMVNGANTLTVNLNGDSLSTVAAGTDVSLIPYWTLGTAFQPTDVGNSFTASTSTKLRGTQILLPDLMDSGINLVSNAIYYYLNGAWTLAGSNSVNIVYNDTVLPPSRYFTVRNSTTATNYTPVGGVSMNRLSIPLDAQTSAGQDNAVSVTRPVAVALNDLGLITSGAFAVSPSVKIRGDLLLTFDDTVTGTNKVASAIYYYYNGAWRLSGAPDSSANYGATTIPYGTGFTIRRIANGTGTTSFWQNTRNY